jgi:hypothetical protein
VLLLTYWWLAVWWRFQPKLFMGWGLMRAMQRQLPEFIQ